MQLYSCVASDIGIYNLIEAHPKSEIFTCKVFKYNGSLQEEPKPNFVINKSRQKNLITKLIITTMKNLFLTAAALLSLNTLTIQASNSLPKSGINPTTTTPVAATAPATVTETKAVQTTISMSPSHNGGGTVEVANTTQPITISIADLSGKNVFEKTITGNSYDLAGTMTTSGIYIISIKQNDSVISSKTWIVTK